MPIELKITGNHATDIVAEVQLLAEVFGIGTATPKNIAGATSKPSESTTSAPSTSQPVTSTEAPSTGGKADAPKTLSRKEQDEATAEMIKNGEKDDRFGLLTKGRQNEVEAALAKPAETEKTEESVDDMFDDESSEQAEVITREMVSKLMGETCKDKNGKTIQDKAVAVRKILVDAIPEGNEIKVVFIPEDKLADVYAAIQKVKA